MKTILSIAVVALAGMKAVPAAGDSTPVTDCPLRDAPFTLETPLIDVLLNDRAKTALVEEFELDLAAMPPLFTGTTPPTFAAILDMERLALWESRSEEQLQRLADRFAEIEVTDADRIARCARYDNDVPSFDLSDDRPRILLFEKINGFRDGPSVDAAHDALLAMGEREGWQIVATQSGGAFNADTLAQFDAVIWNNISGDVLTLSQRDAMRDFIENGGGFVGVHGTAGDFVYYWDWYADTLIGARFAGHPRNPQFQDARVVVDDTSHPAAASLPSEWTMHDEWYAFSSNPRDSGSWIVVTLDEDSYDAVGDPAADLSMGDDHPIAWTRVIGKGRMFYSAIGHLPETYSDPNYVAMLEDAIAWTIWKDGCDCED